MLRSVVLSAAVLLLAAWQVPTAPTNVAVNAQLGVPAILGLSVSTGSVGTPVVIHGANFGQIQGVSTATFNGTAATVTAWAIDTLTTTVPSGATTGNVVVTVAGHASNGSSFTVTGGAVVNPIAAARLPGNDASLPSPTWSLAGVTGGIPTTRTLCTTLSAGASAATISAALLGCFANGIVQLNAGTYALSAGIDFGGNSNVTLRGAGANLTKLVFTNDTACNGRRANICIGGTDFGYYGPGPPTHSVTWSSGYTQGATSIVVSATTGLVTGMYIVLDQLNDTADTGNVTVCITINVCADEGASDNGRTNRAQRQMVKVTNIAGTTLTISPGLQMPNWRTGQTPQAWWGTSTSLSSGDGIEDLSLDTTNGQATIGAIVLMWTTDSWVKGVRVVNCPQPEACVLLYQAAHVTVRDNYFYGSVNFAVGQLGYGIETQGVSDALIENNIVQHRTSPFVSDGDSGSVFAYNYAIDDNYSVGPTFLQASQYSHLAGNGMILHEGNEAVGIKGDIVHGTSNLFTYFRTYSHGWETGKTAETNAVITYALSRYYNFVGNVLGENTYHTTYESDTSDLAIWQFGSEQKSDHVPPHDSAAAATMLRWGNYDTVTDATRFVAGEVPTGIAVLPNALPSSQTLPTSLYLSAKPSFFQSATWPGIGPDVTCSSNCPSGVGSHVIKTPARICYESLAADGANAYKVFNRVTCYGA